MRSCTCGRMFILKTNHLAFLLLILGHYTTFALQDVTAELFGSENHGTVAAFGDLNSDKQTDIFIIRERTFPVLMFVLSALYQHNVIVCQQCLV